MRRIAIGVVAAAMVIAACGGSSNKTVDAGAGSSTTTSGGGGDSSSSTTTGGGGDDFGTLTGKASTADIKITYSQDGGESVTVAQDGKGKSLYRVGDSEFISDGTQTISCDGTTSSATCTQLPPGGLASTPFAIFTTLLTAYSHLPSSIYGGHTSSDSIAGRDASCVTFKGSDYAAAAAFAGNDANASLTICADEETGFLLKFASSDGSTTKNTYLATDVGTSSASDFEPPSTPQTIPSIPSG